MKPVQRIMIRTQIGGQTRAGRCPIEHPAQRHAVHDATVDAETHHAPGPVVDDEEYAVRVEDGRFAPKQIDTPQTIFRMTKNGQPRRPRRLWCRIVPSRKNPSHNILVNGDTDGERDLLGDPGTPPARIPLFHVDNGGDDVRARPLRSRLRRSIRREEPAILPPNQGAMQGQQRRRFEDNRGTDQPGRADQARAETSDDAVSGPEIRRSF